jgi:hypothetical protein
MSMISHNMPIDLAQHEAMEEARAKAARLRGEEIETASLNAGDKSRGR